MNFIKRFFTKKPVIIVEPRKNDYVLAEFYSVPEGKHIGWCRYDKDWELSLYVDKQTSHPVSGRYYSRLAMMNAISKYFRFEGDTSLLD